MRTPTQRAQDVLIKDALRHADERIKALRAGKHGDRAECLYTVPDVCSARWTQEDWDRRCQNPNHK
jgi:hypothetical protein